MRSQRHCSATLRHPEGDWRLVRSSFWKILKAELCGAQNEEDSASTDPGLPADEDVFSTDSQDEGEAEECMTSLADEERQKKSDYQVDGGERTLQMEIERRTRGEQEFEEKLKRIMEVEKLRQKEVDWMEKTAQEKLEQEFQLQQELVSELKRQVEEEVKTREEEQKKLFERKKEEEEGKRREEEKRKEEEMRKEEDRKRREQKEKRMQREEKEKRKEAEGKLKEEVRREQEERKQIDEEKKRMKEEEEDRSWIEEEMRRQREEEEKRKGAEGKLKEEVRRMREAEENERERNEGERRKEERKRVEEEEKLMGEETKWIEEKRIKSEEENERRKAKESKQVEERRRRKEAEMMQMEEEVGKKVEDRSRKEAAKKLKEDELMRKKEKDDRRKEAEKKQTEEEEKKSKIEEEEERQQNAEKKLKEEDERTRKEAQRIQMEDEVMKMDEGEGEEGKDLKEEEKWRKRDDEDEKIEQGTTLKNEEDEVRKRDIEEKMMKEELEVERMKQEDEKRTWGEKEELEKERRNNASRICEEKKEEEDKGETVIEEEEPQEKAEQPRKDAWMIMSDEKMKEQTSHEEKTRKEENNECRRREEEDGDTDGQKNNNEGEEVRKSNEVEDFFKMKTQQNPDEEEGDEAVRRKERDDRRHTEERTKVVTSEREEKQTKNESAPTHLHPPASQSQHDRNIQQNSSCQTATTSSISQVMEQRRLSWMKSCVFWSQLSRQNRSRPRGSVGTRREFRRSAETSGLPPLCPNILKQVSGRRSLQEVTTLVLEDLPGCSLSTLTQCARLQSLTLRRCGLKVLDSINELPELCYVDVQQNHISRLDCENMSSLRVLKLGYNKLVSIHGLSGAENLDLLELSHNSITRVAGLGSLRRLQRLSLDHNQLISTKGLKDFCTLLYLDCSHNHLASVEGLEENVLLNTLDLTSNNLTEPPALHNHVLLTDLHLDDNSISSLQGLAACWLPLLQTLTVAQNRLTHLPPMSAAVSLSKLDLRFNCLSDVKNACVSLEGCHSLKEVHLTGNPLQQESSWRSTLQRAVSSLRTIDKTDTDFPVMDSAVAQQISPASDIFLNFIQAQLQQTHDLRQKHSEQLSKALHPLDAVKLTCQHLTETLRLAEDHRHAHECTDISDKQKATSQSVDIINEAEFSDKVSLVTCNKQICCDTLQLSPEQEVSPVCDFPTSAAKGKRTGLQMAAVSQHQDFCHNITDAVLVQQLERKHKQKWNISTSFTSEDGGGKTECGAAASIVAQHHAATVIQAHWRGFTWRRRLASALAAVTSLDTGEDDIFEVVDLDDFVFDEATLEQGWTVPLCDELPARCSSVSKKPLLQQLPGSYHEHSQHVLPPLPVWRPTQAWGVKGQDYSTGKTASPHRNKSASVSVASGLSERSEQILKEWGFTNPHTAELMLKRAQKMKSKKKTSGPSVHLVACRNFPLTTYQLGAVEAPRRLRLRGNDDTKVLQAEECLGRAKQDRTREWLRNQNTLRCSESEHFLPDISADALSAGRSQRVAETVQTEHLHHTSGVWAYNSLLLQPCRESKCARNNSLGPVTKQDVPPPSQVPSAARRKERISFRDETVRWSGGWGGGKKRDKVKHAHN
ncbi:leucine-rich repeat and IQ domain-containing protein 1 isoform X2 [Dunckerocampus dactyliophorus]|uniref:leucine-rich repeat and IQ domain-containing protein 1 isoform X2 n=1 Tax=Dunckerocampus dactyliophorus TaxID=161453 RepID=UPI0024065F43|nr:leucine-rich repeat and IQ domain-containing protein 1 isoform X2 [Dunckerocampus dactyliophorus]